MNQEIVIITGISGVGKSWLLKQVGARIPIQVLSAGKLIFDQIARECDREICYDDLRTLDIAASQEALEAGLRNSYDPDAQTVVLDAHVVIDTPTGLQSIAPRIFASIGASRMVFLEQEPARVFENRSQDPSRRRPHRNVEMLDHQQREAIKITKQIAKRLGVPFHRLQSDNVDDLVRVLESARDV
ncbi:MAG: AAA family ATPase [Roseovarius sp.]|jgi:adenylate kinase|nr:AAA family ATPase [Roseovarius sp.]